MLNDFFINNLHGGGGPSIFARRLFDQFLDSGLKYSEGSKNRLSIISGKTEKGAKNVLRLDGLYFKKSHPQNLEIFDCYKNFDHIVFQGEFCKKQYEAFTGLKRPNSIIYNGVPEFFFAPCQNLTPKKCPRIIASASWRRHKRLEEIIEAFKLKKMRDVELWVLGGEYFKGEVTPNIKLIKTMEPTALPPVYQSCDGMIHIAWLDWCPNSVIEGLASGLPVLCSSNGGTKELVKDQGIVIKLEDDYKAGTELELYRPPKIDTEIIANGILQLIEIPKIKKREDLKISRAAAQYKATFE